MNNFIVGQVTPDMLENIHYGTYILFGLLTFIGALFVYFVVPETKRLSLEEMVSLFDPFSLSASPSLLSFTPFIFPCLLNLVLVSDACLLKR